MVKEIVLIIFLFNGELSLPSFPFEGTVMECLAHGDKMRIELATYDDEKNVWYLKQGNGTWHGYYCN